MAVAIVNFLAASPGGGAHDPHRRRQRYLDGWTRRDADAVLATLTPDGTYEDPSSRGPVSGEAFRGYMAGLWAAFPDLTFSTESIGEMGPDLVAAQWVMTGTNTGSMMGLPPTGKSVSLRGPISSA